jgi:hypothetical protein
MRRSWLRLFWAGVLVGAAVLGYVVSSGLGRALLHREIEVQLGRLLAGPVAIERVEVHLRAGLELEAFGFEAYPDPRALTPPALRARRVVAGIDSLALLIGRLRLRSLLFEGLHLRVERDPDGALAQLPFPPLRRSSPAILLASTPAEALLQRIESLDDVGLALLEGDRLPRRLEIRDGTLHWLDHRAAGPDGLPLAFRFELLHGVLERDWLSEALQIAAGAVLVDGRHAPFPFEVGLHRDEQGRLEWTLSVSQIPIAGFASLRRPAPGIETLRGTLAAEARLVRSPEGPLRLDLMARLEDAGLELTDSGFLFQHQALEGTVRLELDRQQIHLSEARLRGDPLGLELAGSISRPLESSSRAHIESRLVGIGLDEIRSFVRTRATEATLGRTLTEWTERIESGRVESIEAVGTARLAIWQALAEGRARELPSGFVLGAQVDGIRLRVGDEDRFEDLRGEIRWSGDQLVLRHVNASLRGRALPELSAVLDGVSLLASADAPPARKGSAMPPPLPGLAPLWELLRRKDPETLPVVRTLDLTLDRLDHPLFLRPLRDLRLQVETLYRGIQILVHEGRWGGIEVHGEIIVFEDPLAPSVSARLALAPAGDPGGAGLPAAAAEVDDATREPSRATDPSTRWSSGHVELALQPRTTLPFRRASGFFRAEGASLRLSEIELDLETGGELAARAVLDLSHAEIVAVDLSFAVTGAQLGELAPAVGIPTGLATGRVQATGTLRGALRPGTAPHSELEGGVHVLAQDGRVRMRVPLLLRLAQASEGFNPFANEDELQYESMSATIGFDRGLLSTEDFALEGPLRVFATGRIDTNRDPVDIRAVVGIFLFRAPNQIFETLPLVRSFLPGSDRGLIGTYFRATGPIAEPEVDPLAIKSLMSGVPDALKAPFKMLRFLFEEMKEGA